MSIAIAGTTQGARTSSRTHHALALLFAINLLNFFDRQLPGALGEPIRREFGLSDTALGVIGTMFTLFHADRPARRPRQSHPIVSIGVAARSLMTAASGFAWNYMSLLVTRVGVGLGEAACAPAAQSLIGDLFPPAQRARAIAVFMLGLPLGLFFADVLGGIIGEAWGWRAAFWLAAAPGLVIAAMILLVPEPVRGAAEGISTQVMRVYVLGASFGPVTLGAISDFFADRAMTAAGAAVMTEPFRAAGLHAAMFVIPIVATLAALVLYAASRAATADLRKGSQTSATI